MPKSVPALSCVPAALLGLAVALVLNMGLANPAQAWGKTGHRAAADMASHYLSPAAQAAVQQILGNESLAQAATWPDEMRSAKTEFWQRTASPWHYVTLPGTTSYSIDNAPPQGDAGTALAAFASTLRNPDASLAERQLALRFVVHLVADLHQPFHVGNGADRGGNDVKVEFFGASSNLHAVWDSALVDYEQLSYSEWSEWLRGHLSAKQLQAWADPNPGTWMAESANLRDGLYPTIEEGGNLRWDYVYRGMPVVKQRLAQAGVRTAAYLNWLFQP